VSDDATAALRGQLERALAGDAEARLLLGLARDRLLRHACRLLHDDVVQQLYLKRHQFAVVSRKSAGGHTWINWRNYLPEFAPLLFVEK
jgi:hypothetical protein